jgi:hypothetical protein
MKRLREMIFDDYWSLEEEQDDDNFVGYRDSSHHIKASRTERFILS